MASREYSARLGTLTDEQLQAALDRFALGQLISAEPIANGLFGQNIALETTEGSFIFRGAPHWNPAGEDDWQFQKERWFSRAVHESTGGPTVPWPYLLEEERDIFGWGFAIQPRLPGGPLTQPMPQHYSDAEMREQAAELGRALAALHTVELPHAGVHDPRTDSIRPLETGYADRVELTVEELLAFSAAASPATSEDDIAWVRAVLADARPALEMSFTPTVVHLDYGFHNVLFERRDEGWRVTGVVDWHTAEVGHPECDLARSMAGFRQYQIPGREEFLAAYLEQHPEQPGFRDRFRVFMLWERLLIWEYWQRHKGFKEGLRMRRWMEPLVRMLE